MSMLLSSEGVDAWGDGADPRLEVALESTLAELRRSLDCSLDVVRVLFAERAAGRPGMGDVICLDAVAGMPPPSGDGVMKVCEVAPTGRLEVPGGSLCPTPPPMPEESPALLSSALNDTPSLGPESARDSTPKDLKQLSFSAVRGTGSTTPRSTTPRSGGSAGSTTPRSATMPVDGPAKAGRLPSMLVTSSAHSVKRPPVDRAAAPGPPQKEPSEMLASLLSIRSVSKRNASKGRGAPSVALAEVQPALRNVSKDTATSQDRKRASFHRSVNAEMSRSFAALTSTSRTSVLHKILPQLPHTAADENWGSSSRVSKALPVHGWAVVLEPLFTAVTIINLVWMGISADLGLQPVANWSVDLVFVLVFSIEETIKICSGGLREYLTGSNRCWNVVYSIMNLQLWIEVIIDFVQLLTQNTGTDDSTEMTSAGRALRLLRMLRVLRACNSPFFDDLKKILDGATGGAKTFMWSLFLIALPLYLVALVFRVSLGGDSRQGAQDAIPLFATLADSYFTCFRCLVSGECTTAKGEPIFVLISQSRGWVFAATYCLLVMFFSLALFNVIVAIFVDNSVQAATRSETAAVRARLTDFNFFKGKVRQLVSMIMEHLGKTISGPLTMQDVDDVHLTPEVFDELLELPDFRRCLRELDIEEEEHHDLFITLDCDGSGTLELEELVEGLAKLRGTARRSDIVAVSLRVQAALDQLLLLTERMDKLHKSLRRFDSASSSHFASLQSHGSLPSAGQVTAKTL